MPDMNILIGKTVTAVHLASDKGAIKFTVAEAVDPIVARADGDCCSHSWIENVENVEALLWSAVVSVEDIDMPTPREDTDDGLIQFYGCKITTAKGNCIIDYRNESNGYYGGDLVWPVSEGDYDHFYGGVYGQNVSKDDWQPLT